VEPGMPVPPVLVVVPPAIGMPRGSIAAKFAGAGQKSAGLVQAYQEACAAIDCPCFDAATVTLSSRVDGVHLDLDQHALLGQALAGSVTRILGKSTHGGVRE
jgi:hypothetical protein